MKDKPYEVFVGVDLASREHQALAMNAEGRTLLERRVPHDAPSLFELADRVMKHATEPCAVAVGIEVPHGPVVETLLERGFHVYAINPKQVDRFRDRFSVAGCKDDRRDALVLADSLRNDRHCYRRVELAPDGLVLLREQVRIQDDLRGSFNRAANRLAQQVGRYFPAFLELCPAMNEPWVWDLLMLIPNPGNAHKVRPAKVREVLKSHRIRRIDTDEVLRVLRQPPLPVASGTIAAAWSHIRLLVPQLQLLHTQRGEVDRAIRQLLEASLIDEADAEGEEREHRDADILRSLPGIGNVIAATMLAEGYESLRRRDYLAFRAHAGIAPVTKASGRSRRVTMRRACNLRLRNACYHMARVASQHHPPTKTVYAALRGRGHSHGRALRSVADRLLRILFAMLRDDAPFVENHAPARAAA